MKFMFRRKVFEQHKKFPENREENVDNQSFKNLKCKKKRNCWARLSIQYPTDVGEQKKKNADKMVSFCVNTLLQPNQRSL